MRRRSSTSVVEQLESRQLFAAPRATSVFADNRGEVQITFDQALDPTTVNTRSVFVHLAGADDTDWEFTGVDGTAAKLEVRNPRMRSGNAGVRLEAALAGLGIARITATFCAAAVQQGRLVPLLSEWRCAPLRIYALLPGRRLLPAKVRAFMDALEALPTHQG